MDKGSKGWWDYFIIQQSASREIVACVSLQHVFEPVRLLLIPPRSFLHPPSSSVPALFLSPPSLSYPCLLHPLTPYLDRSHDCCDTSWLTAHLHVFQLGSLIREMCGGGGAEIKVERRWGFRESEVLWKALDDWGALWELKEKREKSQTYRADRKREGKVK